METQEIITNPYLLAENLGIQYSGDVCTEDHGGVFYNTSEWKENGYADAVRVVQMDDAPYEIMIERITINKPDDMSDAFNYCGYNDSPCDIDLSDPNVQIEACFWYGHYDPDNCPLIFILNEYKEEDNIIEARKAQGMVSGFGYTYDPEYIEESAEIWPALTEQVENLAIK